MIVSWKWLADYVALDVAPAEFERRLMMAGLNHEGTTSVGDDLAIDLEITSNRPDCLGHLGVAREAAVLFERELKLPAAAPAEGKPKAASLAKVRIDAPELCRRYIARVIRGVKIGPSPAWLVRRLETIGIAAVNNVVDVTNYVLMECGQPLHAFDLAKLAGGQIIVRDARPGEPFQAINHRQYELAAGMCVIADADGAVALGGVMGGAESEVSTTTVDLLIESAEFTPTAVRSASRALNLHSDSSYRFDRGVDPAGVDWASRRCAELILELAGGELAAGAVDVETGAAPQVEPVTLRFAQLERILGIKIEPRQVRKILTALGNKELRAAEHEVQVAPPSWRADLSREIDLVEEVARIHGYEKIPEDVSIPMKESSLRPLDRMLSRTRGVMTAAGYDETCTLSVVDAAVSEAFSPWTTRPAYATQTPVLRGADRLRRSIVPSLLAARRYNESLSNPVIELFETAKVYLPHEDRTKAEEAMLALSSGGGFFDVKGVLEALAAELNPRLELAAEPTNDPFFAAGRGARLTIDGELLGWLGEVSPAGLEQFDLRGPTTVAEIKLQPLFDRADLVPQYQKQSPYPPISRDLNLVMDEGVAWADVAGEVRRAGGELLESLQYRDIYRDAKRLGENKKSLLLTVMLRDAQGTLTGQEADAVRDRIVAACRDKFGVELR